MIYELITPSDAYTLIADEREVACFAALAVGGGAYGLRDESGESILPFFLLGGDPENWWRESFGRSFQESIDVHRVAIAACLRSFLIGDRKLYGLGLSQMPDDAARERWREAWHDKHRSSLNDIGRRARELADRLDPPPILEPVAAEFKV